MSANNKSTSVTAQNPCPVCQATKRCLLLAGGEWCVCYREANGAINTKTDKDGVSYWTHRLTPWPTTSCTHRGASLAPPERRHRVYEAVLEGLGLEDRHVAMLKRRGFKGQDAVTGILRRSYASLGKNRTAVCQKLVERGLESSLPGVPGFVVKQGARGGSYWTLAGWGGLVIAVRNVQGQIVSLRVRKEEEQLQRERQDNPGGKDSGKYVWVSSGRKDNGVSAQPHVHVPTGFNGCTEVIRITEGEIKSHLATTHSDVLTISIPGVSIWRQSGLFETLEHLRCKVVRLAFDMDQETNPQVALQLHLLAADLSSRGYSIEIERWDPVHKGIDDLLVAGGTAEVLAGPEATARIAEVVRVSGAQLPSGDPNPGRPTRPTEPSTPGLDGRQRPNIIIDTDELRVNDEAIVALSHDPDIYRRGGRLVRVQMETEDGDDVTSAEIVPIGVDTLRERLTLVARWLTVNSKEELHPAHPPMWSIRAIEKRGCWPNLRRLARVIRTPTLRADGSVLQISGYDPTSAQLVLLDREYPAVAEHPSLEEAKTATGRLLGLVAEFPFESGCHRAAWLAAALTPLVRSAFSGPSPLFVIDANAAGSGKSLLCTLIGVLLSGRSQVDFRAFTPDDEEMQKRLVPILQSGAPVIVLDNIATGTPLGGSTLDLVLTGRGFKGRVLGKSEETASLTLDVTWIASGNNVTYGGDTSRRVVPIRLQCLVENPEERSGFCIPRLVEHVQQNRPTLVAAALTIVRGYIAAGRPDQELSHLGSFEGWSDLVRASVAWATGLDPCATRLGIAKQDVRKSVLHRLLDGWKSLPLSGKDGISTTAALRLVSADHEAEADQYGALYEALMEIGPGRGYLPDSRRVGVYLRGNKRVVVAGMYFDTDSEDGKAKVALWKVVEAAGEAKDGSAGYGGVGGVCSPSLYTGREREEKNVPAEERAHTPPTPPYPAEASTEDLEEGDA